MKPSTDYLYRFPHSQLGTAGRCRVRLYKNQNGAYTVVLSESNNNSRESIAAASERIATGLVARWQLNPRTTRWIEHTPPQNGQPEEFGELKFKWNSDKVASDPQWHALTSEEAETWTGDSLEALNRPIGDIGASVEDGGE
jgi:hypothetical protein